MGEDELRVLFNNCPRVGNVVTRVILQVLFGVSSVGAKQVEHVVVSWCFLVERLVEVHVVIPRPGTSAVLDGLVAVGQVSRVVVPVLGVLPVVLLVVVDILVARVADVFSREDRTGWCCSWDSLRGYY